MPRWRHVKRGTTYTELGRGHLDPWARNDLPEGTEIIFVRSLHAGTTLRFIPAQGLSCALPEVGRGLLQRSGSGPLVGGTTLVAYRADEDGRGYVRAADEFDDGRFERLPD